MDNFVDEGAAVVLAAGRGARLGGVAKALLRIHGESYLARIVGTLASAGIPSTNIVVVVAEPFAADVTATARTLGCHVVVNPNPEQGMASSVAVGFAFLASSTTKPAFALLWPVDHPAVTTSTVTALINARAADRDAMVPTCDDRGGHPVLIERRVWDQLAACTTAAMGARTVLNSVRQVRLPSSDHGVTDDVDTVEQLRRYQG